MGVMAWLRDACSAPQPTDSKTAEAATTLHVILLGGSCVALSLLLVMPFAHEQSLAPLVAYTMMLAAHLVGLWQLKRGKVRPVAIAISLFMFAFVTINAHQFGGLAGVGIFVYPTVVLFAGLTWSGRAAIGFALAASLSALGMGLWSAASLNQPFSPPTPMRAWLTMTAVVSIVSVMLMVALRSMRLAAERERVLHEQLREAQRLEALGRLAGGVAHDFNNLLTVILLQTSLLRIEGERDDALLPIEQAALRAAEMTQQLLALGRRQTLFAKVVDVNATLRDTVTLVRTLLPPTIELRVSYGAEVGCTKMDPAGLERVVINLVLNARDALAQGGEISIRTEPYTVTTADIAHAAMPAGRYVKLLVSDNGPGISDSIRARLFEPFATTKANKGTGLGLASVQGIVNQSGGVIHVESELGRGARFEILLPATDEPRSEVVATLQSPTPTPIRVLLVDADPSVRAATRSMLESAGYVVAETEHIADLADVALADTDLLVTDSFDHGGQPFLHARTRHPRLRMAIVRKPFTRAQLLSTLQQALNSP